MFYLIAEKLAKLQKQVAAVSIPLLPNNPSGGVPTATGAAYNLTGAAAQIVFGQTDIALKFTAPATGTYLVAFYVGIDSPNDSDNVIVQLYNASTPITGIGANSIITVANTPQPAIGIGIVSLTAGVEYSLKAHNATGVRGTVTNAGGNAKLVYTRLS